MKTFFAILFAILVCRAAEAAAWFGAGDAREQRTTVTIRADGTCSIVGEASQSRAATEQQVRMMERFTAMQESEEAEEAEVPETPEADASESAATPAKMTDDELEKRLRSMYDRIMEMQSQDAVNSTVAFKFSDETVSTRAEYTYSSLGEMLRNGRGLWSSGVVAFDRIRAEETNGVLRLTLSTARNMQRYMRAARAQWKATRFQGELKVVLPGKVLASDFPEMAENATWMTVDAQKDESLDAAIKMYDQSIVIESETGGLKVPSPLDSSVLYRARAGIEDGADLPVADAGPGFKTEPVGLTITSLHVFPEGEKAVKGSMLDSLEQAGVTVKMKFFAPRGRTILSTEPVHVLKATDDKGRSLAPNAGDEDADEMPSYVRRYSSNRDRSQSSEIDLRLPLPALDAKAIDEVAAEIVAVTAGSWKEMTIPAVNATSTNEIDLSAVLPGAALTITRFTPRKNQIDIEARLTGPKALQRLEIEATSPGQRHFSSHSNTRRSTVSGDTATRLITIRGYNYQDESEITEVSLSVRLPEDIKRERVKFTLTGLDLL